MSLSSIEVIVNKFMADNSVFFLADNSVVKMKCCDKRESITHGREQRKVILKSIATVHNKVAHFINASRSTAGHDKLKKRKRSRR
jgi:hypothetical protein